MEEPNFDELPVAKVLDWTDIDELAAQIYSPPQVFSDEDAAQLIAQGSTGCVPGGVSYVGRTQTQFGSAPTQLNSKRKSKWFRKGQNAIR